MAKQVDLNRLRETILSNQRSGEPLPARQTAKIYATREGTIVSGDEARGEGRELSEVHQSVWAQWSQEQLVAAEKLPSNTEYLEVEGTGGWLYSVTNEFSERYEFFLYHDGSLYQVKVVYPEVEGKYSPHNGHLFGDGRICFGAEGGLRNMEHAYAKSILWATGFSVFLKTGQFPFSTNNL